MTEGSSKPVQVPPHVLEVFFGPEPSPTGSGTAPSVNASASSVSAPVVRAEHKHWADLVVEIQALKNDMAKICAACNLCVRCKVPYVLGTPGTWPAFLYCRVCGVQVPATRPF